MATLKTMDVPALLNLRRDIDNLLQTKRTELQSLIRQLGGVNDGSRPTRKTDKRGRGKVAAKYRHPTTGETWSGRGGTVRWLAEEIKAGKKKEDFLIANSTKKAAGKKSAKKPGKKPKQAK